jgi:hypothetical protein
VVTTLSTHNVLSQPGPEHGRVGVHPRAHAARGHDPDGAKRDVPHGDDHRGADGDGGRVTELDGDKIILLGFATLHDS